jgi:phenylpyruvate tautomerase PptA (4-oxalocrotonate tautomerase family)
MSRPITEAARELAALLVQSFSEDAELAKRLAAAQERLMRANDRLWCGLHPDGLATVYGEDRSAVDVAFAENRSEVLGAGDPLAAVQHVHWNIRRSFIEYQAAAEERRQLAAEVGETIRQFVDELLAAGWSEQQARDANVHELAAPTEQPMAKRS